MTTFAASTWQRSDLERFPFPFPADTYRYSANAVSYTHLTLPTK